MRNFCTKTDGDFWLGECFDGFVQELANSMQNFMQKSAAMNGGLLEWRFYVRASCHPNPGTGYTVEDHSSDGYYIIVIKKRP